MKKLSEHPLIMVTVASALLLVTGCGKQPQPAPPAPQSAAGPENAVVVDSPAAEPAPAAEKVLPKLLDLGAHSCVPCKMMVPILAELTNEYAGRMEVEFIDVWENQAAGQEYGIRSIPTQIFYGSDGKELFRHVGFMAKDDILAKWAELGYGFPEPAEQLPKP